MYYKLPEKARSEMMIYWSNLAADQRPYTLTVIKNEVDNNTAMGKDFLKQLGYEDD